jgi:parvulin-like peptidyl-prolyl isomerase
MDPFQNWIIHGMNQPDLNLLARYRLLRPYLRQSLLDEVLKPITLDQEERDSARKAFFEEHNIDNDEELEAFRQVQHLGLDDLDYLIFFPQRLRKYCQEHFAPKAESRFLSRKQSLDQVTYSLLRTRDAGLARELFLQVREGEASLDELAATYAEGPERSTRGIVGPVPLSQGHPELVVRLRSAEPGMILEPFQIERWWLLVRLERYVPASFGPQASDAMTKELLEEWLEEKVQQSLSKLASEASNFSR